METKSLTAFLLRSAHAISLNICVITDLMPVVSSLSQVKIFHILTISSFKNVYCTCTRMDRHSWFVLSHAVALFPFHILLPPRLQFSMLCYTVTMQEAAPRGVDFQSNKTAKSEKLCPTHKVQ